MSDFPNYKKATNAAYKVLQNYEGPYPKIDIFKIFSKFDKIKLFTYSELAKIYNVSVLQLINEYVPSDHGFTIPLHNTSEKCWVVYYNEKKIMESIRFTLAHELGHIILEHDIDNAINRKEADCFARNLLCPVPLRDELNLTAISDYSQCFNISEYMAEITRGWNKSDKYYISKNNYDIVSWRVYCYFAGYTDKDLYGCVMSELYG